MFRRLFMSFLYRPRFVEGAEAKTVQDAPETSPACRGTFQSIMSQEEIANAEFSNRMRGRTRRAVSKMVPLPAMSARFRNQP